MGRNIVEILIDAPTDEAEAHFENKGRLIGSWILAGILVILAVLVNIFPDLFHPIIAWSALLMASVLWAAEGFGRFVHNRRPLYLLASLILVIGVLFCIWQIVESSIYLMSKM